MPHNTRERNTRTTAQQQAAILFVCMCPKYKWAINKLQTNQLIIDNAESQKHNGSNVKTAKGPELKNGSHMITANLKIKRTGRINVCLNIFIYIKKVQILKTTFSNILNYKIAFI